MIEDSASYKESSLILNIESLRILSEELSRQKEKEQEDHFFSCFGYTLRWENFKFEDSSDLLMRWCGSSFEEAKPSYDELVAELNKLLKLLASLKSFNLSRLIIDRKTIFRTKIQFLFKNLDDSHIIDLMNRIASLIYNYTHKSYIKWKRIIFAEPCASQIQYLIART